MPVDHHSLLFPAPGSFHSTELEVKMQLLFLVSTQKDAGDIQGPQAHSGLTLQLKAASDNASKKKQEYVLKTLFMGLRRRLSKCLPGKSETLTLDPQEQYVECHVLEILNQV